MSSRRSRVSIGFVWISPFRKQPADVEQIFTVDCFTELIKEWRWHEDLLYVRKINSSQGEHLPRHPWGAGQKSNRC